MRSRIASTFWILLALAASSAFGQATNIVQVVSDNTGVLEISDVVSSPDGSHVYITSQLGTIALFARNTSTGRLAFVELYEREVGDFGEMYDIRTAVMAPDGKHLYVRSFSGIVALRRSEDGRLHYLQTQGQGITSFSFTLPPLVIHPNGRFLFATQVSDSGSSIVVFHRDSSTGLLSPAGSVNAQASDGITKLAMSPDGRHLYTLNDPDSITSYSIASGTGKLSFQSRFQAGTAGVPATFEGSDIVISPDGKHVYISSNDRDSTFLLRREASGNLSYGSELTSSGTEADHRAIALSPNGSHAYICREFNRPEVYQRDAVTGALQRTPNSVEIPDAAPACRAMAFSPDGKNLYMPSTDDASLLIFKRQSGSGALSYEDKLEYGETAPEVLAHPVAVAVSGDGNHVYASDVTSEQLAVYRRDRRNGKLTFVELLQEGKYRSLLLSPNGSFLYGLGGIPGNRAGIGIFRRDPTTGKLTPAGDQPSDFSGERFAISRDGKNIYVSLNNESAVAVYQRNATTGQLSLLEVVEDGQGTPDSPSGPTDLAVSPDGKNVYVALANNDGGVAVFRRDPATGRLTLVEALTGISPFSCSNRTLSSATSLAVSPDGGNIYVTSFARRPFIFSRNRSNGRLSNPNCHFTSATHLAVSPDGRFLYTFDEGRTGIFYRTPTSGRLWSVLRAEGFDTFGGRGNPIAVSPDGKNVYIPAQGAGLVVLGEEGEQSEPSCERLVNGEPKRLCFQDSRFKVEVLWRDFEGREGEASAIPLTADSGFFYFFTRQNIELFVKLLDGRENNDHFWFYYGALSNVEYTILVTDTRRGKLRIYHNPAHAFASAGDISAFPDPKDSRQEASAVPELLALPDPPGAKAGACVEGPTTLCLADGRFQAEMTWKDFAGNQGSGKPGALLPNTNGYFWFFNPENVEVAVKVLDGRGVNGHYWVYYASLTNVEFTLTVTDTVTGRQRTYNNPSGRFASHGDIQALPAN